MKARTLLLVSLALGAAVAAVPALLPTGPSASVDAAGLLSSGRFAVGTLATLLAGLLTALTPCVYPLIPVTVSVFGAGAKAEGRGRALMLTALYVLGMGLVFAVLGVVAARSGAAFGAQLGNRWVVTGLAAFMALLASSMFGAFELALPPSVAEKLTGVGGAGLLGAFLMGSVSGFLAAPCTGPVLSGLLAFVAKSQDTLLGGSLLFIYALGIGIPFFLIGAFTVQLPRSGAWMEWVKSLFGVGLLALAVLYLKDAFPSVKQGVTALAGTLGRGPSTALSAVLVAAGVAAGALHASFSGGPGAFARKALSVSVVVLALVLRAGAVDAPRAGSLPVAWGWTAPDAPPEVRWSLVVDGTPASLAALETALARAKADRAPVMLDFYADWCAACKELDRLTYVDGAVLEESRRFVLVKVDGTRDDEALDALFERFGVKGLPTVAFLDPQGERVGGATVTGFLEAAPFLERMRQVR